MAEFVGIGVSAVAVIISILSLKQTQRSIEQANRPYVVVYRDYIQALDTICEYIIVKNFGRTGAIIDSLEFHPNYLGTRGNNVFEHIDNTFIAPSQSISTVTSYNAFDNDRSGITKVIVAYHNGKKHYQDTIKLNEELDHDLAFAKIKPSKGKSEGEIITKTVQEILRRGL
ncbi:hypothetical protein GCM10011391_13560 [Pullulanibacillus camelliae]|uniref:Uncharacterized protein n=1 Tax=Pullulanibacillus camelliae TaxID=1707096 RepID=A0A8J2VPA0_9BACL|nr:hypothetical protein [Pullulanibacillus camelliae]GGE36053.1 hypothetical protein GCM10011391_13560 [Pullulanibacillus camelliae]